MTEHLTEHEEQVRLMRWSREAQAQYPELELLFAIPNGGHRHHNVANKLKAEGVKSGVPDLFLPVPRGGMHGLWVELKARRKGACASVDQVWWLERLAVVGYMAVVCHGWEEARGVIEAYLGGKLALSEPDPDLGAEMVDTEGADLLQCIAPGSKGSGVFLFEEGEGHD